jgi:mandelamide amidase
VLNGQAVPTFPTFIRNTSPGSVGGIPGHQLAGGNDQGRPAGRDRTTTPAWSDQEMLAIAAAIAPLLLKLPAPARAP